jgi:formate hydrogenlyase subunit 6/NADH:ubiquinone oxidoreductase subunit I
MAIDELQERNDRGMPGLGLLKGLTVTLKRMLRPAITQQYPHVKPDLPARTRGVIALKEANCTVCEKCSRACPDWCIYIDLHKETHEPAGGGKGRSVKILDRFAIDYALCMYCGICVEVCPFDALFWSPEYEYAEYDLHELLHEKERLEEWTYTVKPPPELEVGAEAPEAPAAAVGPADAATSTVATPAATQRVVAPTRMAATSSGPTPAAAKAKVEVEPDQAVYDRVFAEEVAKGTPERVAQGKAKRAAMLAARKTAAPSEAPPEAPAPSAEAPPTATPAPTPATSAAAPAAAKDVHEPDQETYDRVFAEEVAKGTPERVAQGKAKRAAMLAARKKAEG